MTVASITQIHVCPPDHKHGGSLTCYHAHRCRCDECETAALSYQARMRRLVAYGQWQPLVPATRARNHIRVLSAAGIGHRRVAALASVSAGYVVDIGSGVTKRVAPDVERRIVAIAPDSSSFAAGQLIPAIGVTRRLQALVRVGWSPASIGRVIGMERTNVSRMLTATRVTVRTHETIAEAYEELWNAAPPDGDVWERRTAAASRRRAAAAGWIAPLGWDDIDTDPAPPVIDEPDGIDVVAVELAVQGARVALTTDERRDAVRQMHARGHGDRLIAHILDVSEKTVWNDRGKLGLPANENPIERPREWVA